MFLNTRLPRRREGGFTLVELLVTILIVTIGVLGLAKLQATAVANTSLSRTRALMTYQAESLAGMIRANKGFWVTTGSLTTWPGFTVTSAGVASDTGLMVMNGTTGSCLDMATPPCSAPNLAWDDMYTWAKAFNDGTTASAFQRASATITCVSSSGGACAANPATPNGYDITLTWTQKLVAVNNNTTNIAGTPVSMVMHVQP